MSRFTRSELKIIRGEPDGHIRVVDLLVMLDKHLGPGWDKDPDDTPIHSVFAMWNASTTFFWNACRIFSDAQRKACTAQALAFQKLI